MEGLEIENLNKKYRTLADALRNAISSKSERKKAVKEQKKEAKAEAKQPSTKPRSFVIDFKGDLKATTAASLREEVTAILDVADSDDEVIVRLENHGGVVHEHGLAALWELQPRNQRPGLRPVQALTGDAVPGRFLDEGPELGESRR